MPATKEQQFKALSVLAPAAVKIERETRLPAELMIGQIMLESDWLQQPSGRNNVFGIKLADRHKSGSWVLTGEIVNDAGLEQLKKKARSIQTLTRRSDGRWYVKAELQFADYDSIEDGVRDYARLLTEGKSYSAAWKKFLESGDWQQLAKDIGGVYATGAGYADLVIRIGLQTNVQTALRKARA